MKSHMVSATPATLATESGHWYLPTGEPFYTIIGTSTGKERPVTIRDARKVNAVPSVTTITRILKSDALERYKLRQLFDAVISLDALAGEDEDAYFARVIAASKQHAERRADDGSKLHAAIEQFLRIEPISDKTWSPHVANIVRTLLQFGINVHDGAPEKSFAHALGFGGKCDWHDKKNGFGLILDFKSKPKLEIGVKKYGYSEQAMQLAAYREGLGIQGARCINVFVGCEDRQVLIHEWPEEDLKAAWEKFTLLLRYWQLEKNYQPNLSVPVLAEPSGTTDGATATSGKYYGEARESNINKPSNEERHGRLPRPEMGTDSRGAQNFPEPIGITAALAEINRRNR